ncbi:MAG TPA: hypothetical protein VG165_02745 [Solirubrobacteraceae bacterium]|jgi:hypothetical protein|nr:hypothetical protein [Solirubrobacteraceae bacterium]
MRDPRLRAARIITFCGAALLLQGCGLFGVAGPGLGPVGKQINPKCAGIPNQNPPSCPLAGVGATEQNFENAHPYVGSTIVIPGQTNYIDLHDTNGLVSSFVEQYHASPPLIAGEARQETHGEMPPDARKIFEKTIGTGCSVVEYESAALRKVFGVAGEAVLVELKSPATSGGYDPSNIGTATITVTTRESRAAAAC